MAKNDNENLVTNDLMKRLIATSQTKNAAPMNKSKYLNNKDMIATDVPAINIALSGSVNGGLTTGITMIAGPSRHFKSLLMLIMAKAYLEKHKDAVCVLYDSEFGTTLGYLASLGIDASRVVHCPILNVEELRNNAANLVAEIKKGDKVCILIDSIGNLASKKEADDALSGNVAADMTRAKQLKSFFRIITPHIAMKDIPLIVVNQTYKSMELYAKDIVSGGGGSMFASNTVWIMGRQQAKEGTDLTGYNFVINVEKSRFVKEKTKIMLSVSHDKGVNYYSGLLEMALAGGFIVKPSVGWYSLKNDDKKVREKDTGELLEVVLKDPEFETFVNNKYQLGASGQLISKEASSSEDTNEEEMED